MPKRHSNPDHRAREVKWPFCTASRSRGLYGALLDCAARARGDDAGDVLALWKRRGKRAFDAEAVSPERLDNDG